MKIFASLEAHYSKRDSYGNCYWALRFVDHETGREVVGTISGGESNIYGIKRCWGRVDGWDEGIQFSTVEHPIREFNRLTKTWSYAGCTPEDLAAWIKAQLAKPVES